MVESFSRDVELHQEIWADGRVYIIRFGDDVGTEQEVDGMPPDDALGVVRHLIDCGRGPVLMFTESRGEAQRFAQQFSDGQAQTATGIEIADQLDLFSEPTEASAQLLGNARKQVAFHSADLTAQERQVVEDGFVASKFDVCFATSTLAAGVNFPFQTVVFPKLTYEWGDRAGSYILKSDYRNMSGRAGRLGMHEQGYSILLPKNKAELMYANKVVLPENEPVYSHLVNISMRRSILMLVSSRIIDSESKVSQFFENSFLWHQISEHNPGKLADLIDTADHALGWLIEAKLLEKIDTSLLPTPIGKAIAETGLLPSTAISFLKVLTETAVKMEEDFDSYIAGIIHWVCGCEEFRSEKPSRFLVYPTGRQHVSSDDFLSNNTLIAMLDRTDRQLNQCAHAMILYCNGVNERQIRHQTNISSGGVHRLAIDVAWVIDGLQRVASSAELGYPQTLTNKFSMLSRRVRWGSPAKALDLIRVANRCNVPGFGRQRALALITNGYTTFEKILAAKKADIVDLLRNENRADALLNAVSGAIGFQVNRFEGIHNQVAESLGFLEILKDCNSSLGVDYEVAVKQLLEVELGWVVRSLDDGKQQNVPDLLVTLGDCSIVIECKTTIKNPPLIGKEEAWAVLQKAADFDKNMHRVTLGKPGFDETCKKKVLSATDISLIEHAVFIEGLLRLHAGTISAKDFVIWLSKPGLIEIERLGGEQTYEIARR